MEFSILSLYYRNAAVKRYLFGAVLLRLGVCCIVHILLIFVYLVYALFITALLL